jgi:hypothetical protein
LRGVGIPRSCCRGGFALPGARTLCRSLGEGAPLLWRQTVSGYSARETDEEAIDGAADRLCAQTGRLQALRHRPTIKVRLPGDRPYRQAFTMKAVYHEYLPMLGQVIPLDLDRSLRPRSQYHTLCGNLFPRHLPAIPAGPEWCTFQSPLMGILAPPLTSNPISCLLSPLHEAARVQPNSTPIRVHFYLTASNNSAVVSLGMPYHTLIRIKSDSSFEDWP